MKLYYYPGACSLGIHVILEEIGKPYEAVKLNLMEGEQYKPEFLAISPKSKVPTLVRDDGSALTEYGAIATWLARTNPEAGLYPSDPNAEARMVEALEYCVSTLHMQGFGRMIRPSGFAPSDADADAVRARGAEIMTKGFELLNKTLEGKEYVAGSYSIADTALFYVCSWTKMVNLPLPANVAAHFQRMLARPAVQRALQAEGLGG